MAVKTSPTPATKPLIPPDESMWQKYSPHFELPLAGATSVFLHGLVIGILAVGGIAFFWAASQDAAKPPHMDVVMVEGGGTGFEGLGGEQGLPGDPNAGAQKTEQVTPFPEATQTDTRPTPRSVKEVLPELGLPIIDDGNPPLNSELVLELQQLTKDADDLVKKEMKIETPTKSVGSTGKKPGPIGTGNPKGSGGLGGSGGGTGQGKKFGPGTGMGGLGGRQATDQEIKASRWRFDLSGDGKEHARKLVAIGFTVALMDPKGGFHVVTDMNRRPVQIKRDNLADYKDAVRWYSSRPESVQLLARELQLPFVPKFVVLFLPKEREQKMANEEKRYADDHRRDLAKVHATWFDFRARNGANLEPSVIRQE